MLQNLTQERRQYKRVRFQESVYFQAIGTHRVEVAEALDFCEGGMRLNVQNDFPLNTPLGLQVPLASGSVCDCLGRVVWVQRNGIDSTFQIGIKFIKYIKSQEIAKRYIEATSDVLKD